LGHWSHQEDGSMSAPIVHRSLLVGTTSPEAAETGNVGDLYVRVNGASSALWVKATGAGTNTGWVVSTVPGSGDALVANPLSQFAATTSLQLKNTISDETGSGALVFATSPTLVTPALGTPASGNLHGLSRRWRLGVAHHRNRHERVTGQRDLFGHRGDLSRSAGGRAG
jgi:hypothetical protein